VLAYNMSLRVCLLDQVCNGPMAMHSSGPLRYVDSCSLNEKEIKCFGMMCKRRTGFSGGAGNRLWAGRVE